MGSSTLPGEDNNRPLTSGENTIKGKERLKESLKRKKPRKFLRKKKTKKKQGKLREITSVGHQNGCCCSETYHVTLQN